MDGRDARRLAGTLEEIAHALRRGATNAQAAAEGAQVAAEVKQCNCSQCNHVDELGAAKNLKGRRMILCPKCGNKRCPKASHHDNACADSNEPGQPGSIY